MLAYLFEAASTMGATSLRGEIIPTAKNAPVRDIFERHAFAKERVDEDGTSIWRLNCKNSKFDYPVWFKIINDKSII
jgi:predicted enzyme involved in methoxymalonyl-ACP biosynthesis